MLHWETGQPLPFIDNSSATLPKNGAFAAATTRKRGGKENQEPEGSLCSDISGSCPEPLGPQPASTQAHSRAAIPALTHAGEAVPRGSSAHWGSVPYCITLLLLAPGLQRALQDAPAADSPHSSWRKCED